MSSLCVASLLCALAPTLVLAQAPPQVAVVRTVPGERTSSIALEVPGALEPSAPIARFAHEPWAVVRGALLPDGSPLIVADVVRRGDGSFGAALLAFDAKGEARVLADRVFHATRPLVTRDGRVFVERGEAGPEPTEAEARAGQLRTDALTIEEIDPRTGVARVVHRWTGYTAHLAGSFRDELILYRVRHRYADLVAVQIDTGVVRTIARDLEPMARDFFVEEGLRRVLFTNLDRRASAWRVYEVDLKTYGQRLLALDVPPGAAPFPWPRFKVVWNSGEAEAREVRAISARLGWVAYQRMRPGELPVPTVSSADRTITLPVPTPPGAFVELLGFAP